MTARPLGILSNEMKKRKLAKQMNTHISFLHLLVVRGNRVTITWIHLSSGWQQSEEIFNKNEPCTARLQPPVVFELLPRDA